MKSPFALSLLASLIAAGVGGEVRPTPTPAPVPSTSPADEWQLTTSVQGIPLHQRMNLRIDKGKVSGWIFAGGKRVPLSGTSDGSGLRFETKNGDEKSAYTGRLEKDGLAGTVVSTDPEDWGESPPSAWRAARLPSEKDRPAAPRTLDFEPVEFHRVFSASIAPVLRIWPGDVVRTKTVDAAGVDAKGKSRVLGGNPQTGPFYVEGAMPGDVIAVHLRRVRLNRSTAISDDGLVERAITSDYA
ncbi:MAG TPA: hypothetical protein VIZ69_08545, partial [Thermoanaerobaculia bacterium]